MKSNRKNGQHVVRRVGGTCGLMAKHLSRSLVLAAVAWCTLTGVVTRPGDAKPRDYDFEVVAKLGDPAPGSAKYEFYLAPQDMNARGHVMFVSGFADDEGNFLGDALFRRRRGKTTLIARSGQPAPGTSENFSPDGLLWPGSMNNAGDMVFTFNLDMPQVPPTEYGTHSGVWRYDASQEAVIKVFAPGDPAPGGTTFRGAHWKTDLNNHGVLVTTGIIDTPHGNCQDPQAAYYGQGRGIYTANARNKIRKIVAPGDPVPGTQQTKTFDDAHDPNINDRGDITFGAHVAGEECIGGSSATLGCFTSLYLYRASTGRIVSIAHQGDPAPGGGTFREVFEGQLNNHGDIVYIGNLATTPGEESLGVFLRNRQGVSRAVARPGDHLPGGIMVQATFSQGNHGINNHGDIAFAAQLKKDVNDDGLQDTGVYVDHDGEISTVVRTGTVIPGLGTVAHTNYINFPYFYDGKYPIPGVFINDRGDVLTQVILENGDNYIVVARPRVND
jgi:hypothetical protein